MQKWSNAEMIIVVLAFIWSELYIGLARNMVHIKLWLYSCLHEICNRLFGSWLNRFFQFVITMVKVLYLDKRDLRFITCSEKVIEESDVRSSAFYISPRSNCISLVHPPWIQKTQQWRYTQKKCLKQVKSINIKYGSYIGYHIWSI